MMVGDGEGSPRNREDDSNEELLVWESVDVCITNGGIIGGVGAGW